MALKNGHLNGQANGKAAAPRRIVLLGATGSVGRSTVDLLERDPEGFSVAAVAGGRDARALADIARRTKAEFAAIRDENAYSELKEALAGTNIQVAAGREAVIEAALREADLLVSAIVGAAGVEPTHAALSVGRDVALANKECLVCAGAPFMRTAKKTKAQLLPVDSEHNAIFQALGGEDPSRIERMIVTASGGPFRTWSKERIDDATVEEALNHPNWAMGPKITVDSAGMMNKGLELIEAHHLFGVPAEKLEVVVHPQSIVHGLVAFSDGSVTAGMAPPDMRVPIAHCLGYPDRLATPASRLDFAKIATLTFEAPDFERFPALKLALDALAHGGGLTNVLNAANEIAVQAFLDRRISFSGIARHVAAACETALREGYAQAPESVEEALGVDHIVRERSRAVLAVDAPSGMLTLQ
ncbi:1-deoxy-D-xylulose-5-phosphate reductoisomerase [Methylocystis parvus]|uniref:1-deoxy-D-xylulose 5-phosphate reductoisomerase n=1 Tax=Methylocystis parvus TaxID=134 RepID=A0A6B8LXE2_9HYPH|nr:1-deoxy-D-xylulose-5-phosphate reductoisomerase [Methylocystis parvus]QGM96114.1 1-deoxy-D-xylulose-5-phosphate reductoisomerase [Methylocystis parvus]WBK00063.1 1-deoxy-D-xylulose-5-phosphate reductoisomerase [Methylocystis parvus OBBP]